MTRPLAFLLPLAGTLLASSCSSLALLGLKQKDGLEQVDELLSDVERVQVESAVAKDRALTAIEGLRALLAPEFRGDPASAHAQFVAAVEQSTDQAEALRDSVQPLRRTGEAVFKRWTEDLEAFGNISMRQRSQERLEANRQRYDAILSAAVSAQLAYDAFNGDLSDHALFLEHDFNATAVGLVAQELDGLKSRGRELAKRLEACISACQGYVEFSAPSAETPAEAAPAEQPAAEAAPAQESAPQKPAPRPAPKKKPAPAPSNPQGG